ASTAAARPSRSGTSCCRSAAATPARCATCWSAGSTSRARAAPRRGRPAMGGERRVVIAGPPAGGAPPDAPATGPEPPGADPGDPSHPGGPCAPAPRTGDAEARALVRTQLRIALGTGAIVLTVVT